MKNNIEKIGFENYIKIFLEQNSKINLISKNDEKLLWEKHICDSLAITKFFEKYNLSTENIKLLDIGTGGGFPSLPVAINYSDIQVVGLDSIKKKVVAISNIAQQLELKNFQAICERAENFLPKYKNYFDVITSRAVAELKIILKYGLPLLKSNGYFVAYKSVKTEEEIKNAIDILRCYKAKVVDIIPYELPLDENYTRNLIIIKK